MEENKVTPFIQEDKKAISGCVNGIFLYDFLWPFLGVFVLQLIFQDSYQYMVDTHYDTMRLLLMLISGTFTLFAAFLIAKPMNLLYSYKAVKPSNIGFILKCLGSMILFSYVYNLILFMFNVDIAGGNANQENVITLIKANPYLSFASMIIMAPILEEVTYRYFLFGGIAKYNRKWAVVISGFIFMAVHAVASFSDDVDNIVRELLLLPPYMFSGMVLAYAYDKTENLATSTIIHALNNLISFILCML